VKANDIRKLTAKLNSIATMYSIEIKCITLLHVFVSWPSSAIYSPAINTMPWIIGRRRVPVYLWSEKIAKVIRNYSRAFV